MKSEKMDWAILRGREGCYEQYSSLSEFIHDLDEEADLAHEISVWGCVLYEKQQQQQQILTLMLNFAAESCYTDRHYMMQFWGVVKVEGSHHYLSSSHHPFCFKRLMKGICWYRKLCRDHVYVVDVGDEKLGGVGRAYRNKHPESTPDLRLYSTYEFPMRDDAAGCGFRSYMALPLFDCNTNEYYGVLELLLDHDHVIGSLLISKLDRALQRVWLRSTHNSVSISDFIKEKQPEREMREILELAVATVPQLYLALVWVPCNKQCVNIDTNLCCMELASFITSENKVVNSYHNFYGDMYQYLDACAFHNLLIDVRSCHSNLCDHFNIAKNPLAHYAQRARMSNPFVISHHSNRNHLYIIQFFLQPKPKFREVAYGENPLVLLLGIVEMNLKNSKYLSWGQNVEKSEMPELLDGLKETNSYKQKISESNFTTYLETVDLHCLRPSSADGGEGWVFCLLAAERLLVRTRMREKIENFMKNVAIKHWGEGYWLVQFWAPKMVENRCYLETSDQPYAVGCLAKGLASFRKKCTTHYYFVDEQAVEEELGPPGRVFRSKHLEITPDLFHYTTEEFPIRNYAMHCCSHRGYFVLPIFDDEHNHKCVGVLEFLGFHYHQLEDIREELKDAKLCSIHTDLHPSFLENELLVNSINCRREALSEVNNALERICDSIPQLHMANVWVPKEDCDISTNMSCMKLEFSTNEILNSMHTDEVNWIHVQSKKGIVGMVLASENKSCFCLNLYELSIVDQPLSHFEMSERYDVCFAICLQSSHTGELPYVAEFFLYPVPATYEYLRSFLNFLLKMMKQELKSFKMACGKQLGEELVVEVIEFSDANKLDSSDSEHTDVFPIKFKSVQYSQHSEEQHTEEHNVVDSDSKRKEKGKRKKEEPSITASDSNRKQKGKQKREAASDAKTRDKGETKTGLSLSYEILKPHFGKKLQDVEKELGCKRSTIKRTCRKYGIKRWPNKKEHIKNLSLFERESGSESTNTESTHPLIVEKETEKVIIKVKDKEDTIKFELCLSLGVGKLFEEVAKKFNLKVGAFKLKYMDEDEDEILLTCDEDLQLCPKSQTATGKTCIHFYVQLISK
ncbi:protein NLP6-like [Salvia miltiorrhiza]|uniref:protein NLP6-like n=1 Tax=Salvia miltiorrhiza TaxID=226208 RepID=UPI0025AB6B89|nr:protein NLP6-like [Salvia miltiorrhiza]